MLLMIAWSSIRIVPKVGHGLHDPEEFVTQERGRWDGVLMKRGLSPPERLVVAWIDGGRGADQSFLNSRPAVPLWGWSVPLQPSESIADPPCVSQPFVSGPPAAGTFMPDYSSRRS